MRVEDWIKQASPEEQRAMLRALVRREVDRDAGMVTMDAHRAEWLERDGAAAWFNMQQPLMDGRVSQYTHTGLAVDDHRLMVNITLYGMDGPLLSGWQVGLRRQE